VAAGAASVIPPRRADASSKITERLFAAAAAKAATSPLTDLRQIQYDLTQVS
jgi:hypothetical protein